MKNLLTLFLIISFSSILFLSGCEDYLNVNDNPNNPTEAPAQGLLTHTTFETAQNTYRMGSVTSYYVQYLASPNSGSSTDVQEALSFDTPWLNLYDILTDLSDLEVLAEEELTEDEGSSQFAGIAKILKAYNLGLLVDAWGEVPYSEAFFAEAINPEYDDQQTLYDEIFTLLDDGIQLLQTSTSAVIENNEDFIYEGNTVQWEQFGYMLQARYLNHLSKQASYDPQAVLDALDNGFTSNDDDAQVEYFEEEVNPWASVAIANAGLILGGWLSEQTVEHLDGTTYGVEDPRIGFLMNTNDDGDYIGVENGAGRGTAPAAGAFSVLTTDTYYAGRTAPVLIATYAEQKFIEAEAALNATQPARAYQAYLDGIEAHMDKIGVDEADKNAYLTDPAVAVGEAGLTIDLIMKEKYTAMFLHPEAWVDARRYDYGYENMTIPANLNSSLNGEFIRRLVYPDSEEQRNVNTPDVSLLDRLFWDQ